MVRSTLFNQSPDWAKIIGDSYASVNASEEYNESLEKENDRRRIENAGVPLKMLESAAKFSKAATSLKDAIDEKAEDDAEKLRFLPDNLFDGEKVAQTNTNTVLDKANNEAAKELNKLVQEKVNDKNFIAAEEIQKALPFKRRDNIAFVKTIGSNLDNEWYASIDNFTTDSGKTIGDKLSDAEHSELHMKWLKAKVIQPLQDRGLKVDFIREYLLEDVKKHKNSLKAKNDKEIEARWNRTQDEKKLAEISGIFSSEGFLEEFQNSVKINAPKYDIGQNKGEKEAARDILLTAISAASLGHKTITFDKIDAIVENYEIDHAGSGKGLYTEHFPAIELEFRKAIRDGKEQILNNETTDKSIYTSEFINGMREERTKNGGSYTQEQLAQNIRENWDIDKYGKPPATVTGFATDEVKVDEQTIPYLKLQWDKGLLTEDMVYMLNDAEDRKTWLSRVGELSPDAVIDSKELTAGIDAAVDYAQDHAKLSGKKGVLSAEVEGNIKQNAKWYYPSIVTRKFNEGANSMQDAIIAAREEMKELVTKGKWDTLVSSSSDVNERKRNLAMAQGQLKYDMSVIDTSILAGSESILESAESLNKKNIVHPFYVQLSKGLKINGKPVFPMQLQNAQLEVKAKLEKAGKPVKSVVLQAWEAMPETTQELLSNHVSQARLARAKVEAFYTDGVWNKETQSYGKGDGVINYSDPSISKLADEILANETGEYDDFLYKEGYDPITGDVDSEFDQEEQVFSPPKVRQLSNKQLMRRNMSKYSDSQAAENLKKFVKSGLRLPGMLLEDVFATEAAVFDYIGTGLEERREEVAKQKKQNKRKRY